MFFKVIVVFFSINFFSLYSLSTTIVVTNKNDVGIGSLRQAATDASSEDTIRFDPLLLTNAVDSISLSSHIDFGSKAITLKGLYNSSDTLFISGQANSGIFSFNGCGKVVLDSLVLINGRGLIVNSYGVAAVLDITDPVDTIRILNSVFRSNFSETGGFNTVSCVRIFSALPAALIVQNSKFLNNIGEEAVIISLHSDVKSSIQFDNSKISDNENGSHSVFCASKKEAYLSFLNSELINNINGGIFCTSYSFTAPEETSSIVEIYNSSFKYNTGNAAVVGSVSNSDSNARAILLATNCIIDSNSTSIVSDSYSGSHSSVTELEVDQCVITNNVSNNISGIRCVSIASSGSASGKVNITNSKIDGHNAYSGGGIHCTSYTGNNSSLNTSDSTILVLEIDNSTISNNSASFTGGGIHAFCETNSSSHSKAESTIMINRSTISNNSADDRGGGLFSHTVGKNDNPSTSMVDILTSTLGYNETLQNGGGFYITSKSEDSTVTAETMIENSTVVFNNADSIGSAGFLNAESISNNVISELLVGSSIVSSENASNLYHSNPNTIVSEGYNIFSNAVIGASIFDTINATLAAINLVSKGLYGGSTETMVPIPPSIAIDNGNPLDMLDAQNRPISGTSREIGAAEYCPSATYSVDTQVACNEFTWIDGITYTTNNSTAIYNLLNSVNCDSIVTLDLTLNKTSSSFSETVCKKYLSPSGLTYYTSGIYMDTITNSVGCDSVVTIYLTVNNANIGVNQFGSLLISLMANGYYQWLKCPEMTPINEATGQVFYATENGDYAVIVTGGNGCTDTSLCYTISNVGFTESLQKTEITVFPNPTTGSTLINLGDIYTTINMQLYDMTGKAVLTKTFKKQQFISVDIEKPPGLYQLIIDYDSRRSMVKLIKE